LRIQSLSLKFVRIHHYALCVAKRLDDANAFPVGRSILVEQSISKTGFIWLAEKMSVSLAIVTLTSRSSQLLTFSHWSVSTLSLWAPFSSHHD